MSQLDPNSHQRLTVQQTGCEHTTAWGPARLPVPDQAAIAATGTPGGASEWRTVNKIASMKRSFDELVAEADSVSIKSWDFSWLDGRGTEERPVVGVPTTAA